MPVSVYETDEPNPTPSYTIKPGNALMATVSEAPASSPIPARQPIFWVNSAAAVAGLLITLGTLLGVTLHLTGHVAHITHLRDLGVLSDLFPRGVEWTTINGYYAVFSEWKRTLEDMPWLLLFATCLLLAFAIWIYRLPARERGHALIDKLPQRPREIAIALGAASVSIMLLFYLLFVILLVAIIPGVVGERAGHYWAQQALASFRASDPENSPTELWQGQDLVMQGHLIAASETLLALYDAETQQVRTFNRGDLELRTRPRIRSTGGRQDKPVDPRPPRTKDADH